MRQIQKLKEIISDEEQRLFLAGLRERRSFWLKAHQRSLVDILEAGFAYAAARDLLDAYCTRAEPDLSTGRGLELKTAAYEAFERLKQGLKAFAKE